MANVCFYCTQGGPYLVDMGEFVYSDRFRLFPALSGKMKPLNGMIIASAMSSKAYDLTAKPFSPSVGWYRHGLSESDLCRYQGGHGRPLWGIALDQMLIPDGGDPLQSYYSDRELRHPILKAPQGYRSCWRPVICSSKEAVRTDVLPDEEVVCFKPVKYWMFSVHSEFAAKLLTGSKTMEVRHSVPSDIEKVYFY